MLEQLKEFLGIEGTEKDSLLKTIISNATARLKLLLGGLEPQEELDHIILEVAIIRYNRIGSEGMKSHTVEGESVTFSDDDFEGFKDEIQSYLDSLKTSTKGKVRFI